MTESEYIERISELWPEGDEVSPEALALSAEAIQAHPESPELWCMRGHLVELAPESDPIPLTEALECYRKAVEIDSGYADAWESIGYYLDNYDEDFEGADKAFRRAIASGGDQDSYIGLARVLAQKGRQDAALRVLSEPDCPYAEEDEVVAARQEIEEGLWSPDEA